MDDVLGVLRAVGFSNRRLADILGVTERQVQRWADGEASPRDQHAARLYALNYITERLMDDLSLTWGTAERWWYSPCRDLAGAVPADLVKAGRHKTVVTAVERILSERDEVRA